jgi:hypothetical protein
VRDRCVCAGRGGDTAMEKLRIVTLGVSGGRRAESYTHAPSQHAAVSRRRPPISLHTMVPRTGGYAYDVGVWDVPIIQGAFSVASCQTRFLHRCSPAAAPHPARHSSAGSTPCPACTPCWRRRAAPPACRCARRRRSRPPAPAVGEPPPISYKSTAGTHVGGITLLPSS